jgi:hypothetical protein
MIFAENCKYKDDEIIHFVSTIFVKQKKVEEFFKVNLPCNYASLYMPVEELK